MKDTERVAIFIDGSNLYHGLKNYLGHARIDFKAFCDTLVGDRYLTRIYYYNAPKDATTDPENYKHQQQFFNSLKKVPFLDLKLGRLEKRMGGYIEKGVDLLITVDMIRYATNNAYDTAILVSGDGDYAPLLEFLKGFGKHIENAYFSQGCSYNLKNHSDRFINLDSLNWDRIIVK